MNVYAWMGGGLVGLLGLVEVEAEVEGAVVSVTGRRGWYRLCVGVEDKGGEYTTFDVFLGYTYPLGIMLRVLLGLSVEGSVSLVELWSIPASSPMEYSDSDGDRSPKESSSNILLRVGLAENLIHTGNR